MILEVIKPQIAIGTKSVSAAYGEILYRAWKENQGESKPVDSVPGEYENPVSREVTSQPEKFIIPNLVFNF